MCDQIKTKKNDQRKIVYVHIIKGTCYNCGKYGLKRRNCKNRRRKKALYILQEICTHHLRILQKSELWAGMHSLSQEG